MVKLLRQVKTVTFVKMLGHIKRRFNILFILTLGILSLLILFGNRNSVYGIKGNTQTITLTTSSNQLNKWELNTGTVFDMSGHSCSVELSEDNVLALYENIKITITSEIFESKPRFLLIARKHAKPIAKVSTSTASCEINDYLEVTIDAKNLLTMPFEAVTFIGEDVGSGVDKLLLDGSVDILEKQFFSAKRYIGETVHLNMGDRVRLEEEHNNEPPYSKGFIRFIDNSDIYFSVTSQAKSVLIERFGSSTITVSPSVWSRMTNDPVVAALGSLFALLFVLVEFFMAFNQIFKKEDK